MRRREQYARRKLRRGHGDDRFSEDKTGRDGPRGRRIAASARGSRGEPASAGDRHTQRLTGRLAVQRSGVGFVAPDSGRGGDIFVHASNFGEAWHGDRVEVALLPRRGRSREGVITAVLKRGRATITAEIMRAYGKDAWLTRPLDSRLDFALLAKLPEEDRGGGTKRVYNPLGSPSPDHTPSLARIGDGKAELFGRMAESPVDPASLEEGEDKFALSSDEQSHQTESAESSSQLGIRREGVRGREPQGDYPLEVPSPGAPKKGDIVLLRAGDSLEGGLWAAEILDNFGPGDDLGAQERIVKAGHGIPTFFPADVLEQAEVVHAGGAAELEDIEGLIASGARIDLRHIPFVTIDGENARDFDDAVYVEESARSFILWVGIADVSHYVRPGTPLDREALSRGNSYYFPQSVEPMLPEALSNDLCSLKPGVPRLAVAAKMHFDREGRPAAAPEFFVGVIQSRARLTYTQVFTDVIEDRGGGTSRGLAPCGPLSPDIHAMLKSAEKLARLMHGVRHEAGGLDFELPEPEVRVSEADGELSIVAEERNFAHQLIEMFMVAANEAVAGHLTRQGVRLPYRVHPPPDPDKLVGLFDLLARTGLMRADGFAGRGGGRGGTYPGAAALPGILDAAQGTDAEYVVARLVLRSMMQARYSLDNEGHFGLASECYCHFTSPIRRYADLLVHRALKRVLGEPGFGPLPERVALEDMLDIVNADERTSKEAEREILRRLTVLILRERVGEVFAGVVSGVTDFGIFVELAGVMAEGMIPLTALADDYYDYFPERQELMGRGTRQRFYLGLPMRVRLVEANLRLLEINLEPAAGGRGPQRREREDRSGEPGGDKVLEQGKRQAGRGGGKGRLERGSGKGGRRDKRERKRR